MATELVAFLRARLAEEERIALAVDSAPWWQGEASAPGWDRNLVYVDGCNNRVVHDLTEEEAAHVALWDPHRVLADVAAKQAILDAVFHYEAKIDGEWGDCCSAETIADGRCEYTPVDEIPALLALVQPYDGHPDFNPAWSVSAGVR